MNKQNFFKMNKIIFIALIMGMVIFAVLVFFLNSGKTKMTIELRNVLTIAVPIVLLAGIAASKFMFKKLMLQLENAKTLQQKTTIYTTASLIRYALIEGPVILSVVAFLMSSNLYFLIFTAAGILYFASLMPNPEKIVKELKLSYDERNELGMK